MEISASPVYKEVLAIFGDGAKPVSFKWEATIHANQVIISVYQLNYLQIKRGYHTGQYTDDLIVEVKMRQGDYNFLVWPYKDTLEILLTRTPMEESTASQKVSNNILHLRYRAIPLDSSSSNLANNDFISSSKMASDNLTIKTAKFQLIDLVIERLRMMSGGCVVRDTDPANAVRALMGLYSDQANIDSDIAVKGVDLAENHNSQVRDHIIIPHGTRCTDIPFYVHRHCGGLYATGMGAYLQNSIWYIFPPYNLNRYHTSSGRLLTVVNLPKNRLPMVERTYRITQTQIILIANGESKHADFTEPHVQNEGNGVRYGDATKMFSNFVSVDNNQAVADRSATAVETIFEQRATGLNNVTMSETRFTANSAYEKSKLAYRAGMFIIAGWEQADPTVIYPGMPVRYIFQHNNQLACVYGTVIGAQYAVTVNSKNMIGGKHACNGALQLFLEKDSPLNTTLNSGETINQ